jgi:hypothetical protein
MISAHGEAILCDFGFSNMSGNSFDLSMSSLSHQLKDPFTRLAAVRFLLTLAEDCQFQLIFYRARFNTQ